MMDLKCYEHKVRQVAMFVIGPQTELRLSFLGRGATSAAWRVDTQTGSIVIRLMPSGTNRPVTYRSECMILNALRAKGRPVPMPLARSIDLRSSVESPIVEPWAVTQTVNGSALGKQPLPQRVAHQLGQLLAELHAIPATGHGRLLEQDKVFRGQHNEVDTAVPDRWRWGRCWPFDGSALETHPYLQMVPEALNRLAQLESEILDSASRGRTVINHADLHGEHIFVQGERLTGVVDFGAAFVGVPGWDFASIAHNHGWEAVEYVAAGYTTSDAKRSQLLQQSSLLAIVVSMYKLSKAIQEGAPKVKIERIQKSVTEFLAHNRQTSFTNRFEAS